MSVRRTGNWALARRLIRGASDRLPRAIDQAVRQEAQLLRKEIVQGITRQAPGGEDFKPLSELTLARRQKEGFGGTKKLLVRGDLRNGIAVLTEKGRAFIGVPRKARGAGGSLADVAKLHEFGSDPIIVPQTDASRAYFGAMLKEAGLEPEGGGGGGDVFVIQIPARPFLRPAFKLWQRGAQQRFLQRLARAMGMRG